MRGIVLLVSLVIAGEAAAASWWSIKIPAEYMEISDRANKQPMVAEMLESRRMLGTASLQAYKASQGGSLVVVEQINTKYSAISRAELDRLEEAERTSNAAANEQLEYRVDHTAHLVVGTQKTKAGQSTTLQKRWMGVATDDSTRTLAVLCSAPEETCQSIIGTVVIDEAQFRRLDSMKPLTATDVGERIAVVLAAIGFIGVAIVVFRRKRHPPAATATASPEA